MKRTDEEHLQELDKKMEQLKARKKALECRTKEKARRERTRRLIQLGALSEKYFDKTDISPEDYELFLKELITIEQVRSRLCLNKSPDGNLLIQNTSGDTAAPRFADI